MLTHYNSTRDDEDGGDDDEDDNEDKSDNLPRFTRLTNGEAKI